MPTLTRRDATTALLAAGFTAFSGTGRAQGAYPKSTINVICAFPPGTGADVLVRFYANKLGAIAGVPVIVNNRSGAFGNIAAEYTARSKPDGYTILVHGGNAIAGSMSLYKKPPLDVINDIRVAATLSQLAFVLLVPDKSPYKTLQDLTAAMMAKGEKGTYGTPNLSGQITGELYKKAAGLKTVNVSYKASADYVNDLSSGSLDFAITDGVSALGQAQQGRFRLLAISSPKRMESIPSLPTFVEGGVPGVDVTSWWGAMVPFATPQPIVEQIHKWFAEILKAPDTVDFLKRQGNDVLSTPPDEGQKLLARSIEDWKRFVEVAKIEKQ